MSECNDVLEPANMDVSSFLEANLGDGLTWLFFQSQRRPGASPDSGGRVEISLYRLAAVGQHPAVAGAVVAYAGPVAIALPDSDGLSGKHRKFH